MRRTAHVALLAVGLVTEAGWAGAQSTPPPLQFEVASVRRNVSGDGEGSIGPQPNGRFVVSNVPLRFILQVSYELPAFRVVGGPDWIDAERYDIQGKAAGVATNAELYVMMRALLGERFKLKTHTDTRPVAGFALVRARQDGRLGLARRLARPVVDRTSLAGLFDIQLEWTEDARSSAPLTPAPAGDGVSVYTALQEQLGLKLQGERIATEFMVIDHVEHPTDD